jgi:hypothetical protein
MDGAELGVTVLAHMVKANQAHEFARTEAHR